MEIGGTVVVGGGGLAESTAGQDLDQIVAASHLARLEAVQRLGWQGHMLGWCTRSVVVVVVVVGVVPVERTWTASHRAVWAGEAGSMFVVVVVAAAVPAAVGLVGLDFDFDVDVDAEVALDESAGETDEVAASMSAPGLGESVSVTVSVTSLVVEGAGDSNHFH